MIVVEPPQVWQQRMIEERLRAEEEARKRASRILHPIQSLLMDIVKENDEPEIRNTKLAHEFARIAGYRNRKERDDWIKTAWRHMSSLIFIGKLEWGDKRNHVRLAPPEKHQAYQSKIDQMLSSLPPPQL